MCHTQHLRVPHEGAVGGDTVKTESRGARRHGLHPHFFSFSHPPTPAKQKKEEEEEEEDDDDDD